MKSSIKTSKLKPAPNHKPLPAQKLQWYCNPKKLSVKTTADLRATREIIGQDRALNALRTGLEISHKGFNIFATGMPGTGKETTIKQLLNEITQKDKPKLHDHCYVNNFEEPDSPRHIALPAGQGRAFREDMKNFIDNLLRDIPSAYESSRYQQARKGVIEHFQDRQKSVLVEFEKRVKENGFELVQVQVGNAVRPDILPVIKDAPINMEQVEKMIQEGEIPKEQYDKLKARQADLEKQMIVVFRQIRNIDHKLQQSIHELDERMIMPVIDEDIDIMKTTYDSECVHKYLGKVRESIGSNLERFRKSVLPVPAQFSAGEEEEADEFIEFQVNLIVDNSKQEHSPVIFETNPKYKNLFGTIEREFENGGWTSDFMHIKAGSLLRADGGYLVLNANDVLVENWVWQDLKRTLRSSQHEIHSYESLIGFAPMAMKPEPIPFSVKVIMLGEPEVYNLLFALDPDFNKIFKIRADFDYEMPRTKGSVAQYISFVKKICEDENLLHFSAGALAKIVEFGIRLAGNQNKLSTRFNILADVVRESNYWARKEKATMVSERHIKHTIEQRAQRISLTEDKLRELIIDNTILIDTKGKKAGQVNGLSIYDNGEHSFGHPTRITAKTSLGRQGIINIEREAELSGPIHNKGMAIINGYLRSKFAQNKPLVMDASLTFEQSYGGVDGDSASSTEIYAILSALSEAPLRQDIAVTGSVNQNGEIQPIGGVNLKIEGFFDVCKTRGLTGSQSVIIPQQNVKDLMLKEEVIGAIQKKQFHIFAVETIEEGIEILTGIKAGKKNPDGKFEKGTIYQLADDQLLQYAESWKTFERGSK